MSSCVMSGKNIKQYFIVVFLQFTFSFNLAVTTCLKHKHILVANGLQRKKDLFEYWLVLKTPMLS